MTDFRTTEDIQADFRRIDPSFTQFTSAAQLLGTGEILDGGTSGPTVFNLGVINATDPNSEWQGVVRFLNSRLVTPQVRRELQQLQRDLQAADTNHDGILNNQELVAYAQAHTDRWPNVVTFRSAADMLLNRLPSYLAQTNLNNDQIAHLWGVMNQLARERDRVGADPSVRGQVYGLTLTGFPSNDRNNPPDLIRRAMRGELNPAELAAVHHILQVQSTPQGYNFQSGSAPMNPIEIGALSLILDRAAQAHHSFQGMTLVSGDAETQLYTERNRSLTDCHAAVQRAANSGNDADVDRAYADCAASLNRVETDQNAHPDQIGIREILLRARDGVLTPAETAMLRAWMAQEQQALGMVAGEQDLASRLVACEGPASCMVQGALRATMDLVRNPHNLAFIGGGMLYRRFLLRNLFERNMTQICGGPVANPAQAFRDYERFLGQQMQQSPRWLRFVNQLIRNPRASGFWGRAGINLPVNILHLVGFTHLIAHPMNRVWNSVADRQTHPVLNEGLQYLTDGLVILLFNAWETADVFRNSALQNFQQANPGVCRPQPQTSEQTAEATAPAPEENTAAQAAPLTDAQLQALSRDELAEYIRRPYGQTTQAQFEEFMNAGSPVLTADQIGQLPPDAQVLFESDEGHYWGISIDAHRDSLNRLMGTEGAPPLAEALVQRYAADNPELAASIRSDLQQLAEGYRPHESIVQEPRVNAYRWALRDYIQNLQAGNVVHAQAYLPAIQPNGFVRAYFEIRETQQCMAFSVKDHAITFDEAATAHWNSVVSSTFNRLHPETWTHSSPSSSSEGLLMPDGRPMPIFIPLPCGLAGSAISGAGSLIRSLFGVGEAVEETAPAWGYGAAAFAGGA